jgi:hypothetical protein
MSSLTDTAETLLLQWLLTASAVTRPTVWYVGIGSGATEAGLTGEFVGNGYARKAVTFGVVNGLAENNAAVLFDAATGLWGTGSHFGIFDALTGGTCLLKGAMSTSKTYDTGDRPEFAVGDIDVSFTNLPTDAATLVLQWLLTAVAVTRPTAWHVALGTGSGVAGLTGEPVGNGYARRSTTFSVSGNVGSNPSSVLFDTLTGPIGSISHGGVFTAATAGTCLFAGALGAAKTFDANDRPEFAAGALSLSLD